MDADIDRVAAKDIRFVDCFPLLEEVEEEEEDSGFFFVLFII
jgi:hypothetical protein